MFDQEKYIEAFSQVTASEQTLAEVLKMTTKKNKNALGRLTRALLVAVVISAMLATTAFAYVGFTQYENPMDMLKTFFGTSEYEVDEGGVRVEQYFDKTYEVIEPTIEKVPVDTKVAEENVAPYLSAVGQSVSYGNYKFTIEAHQYDSATECGIIYYTLENPDGLKGYKLQFDGEVWWPQGELILMQNAWEKNYIVEEETTDTKLSVAAYYCGADEGEVIEVCFYGNEQNFLTLPLNDGGGMKYKEYGNESIVISPIALKLHLTDFDFLGKTLEDGTFLPAVDDVRLDYLAVRFQDGTEYVIAQDDENAVIRNSYYVLIEDSDRDISYMFNRIIDVDTVDAVIINDREFKLG